MPTKPVYALVGDDSFLQLQKLGDIRAQLSEDVQTAEFDGESAQLADVLDELRSFAMFGGGGKLVLVRNADEFISRFREQLEEYVAKPSDSGVLVLRCNSLPGNQRIAKLIAKHGEVTKCEPPVLGKMLVQWIVDRGRKTHKLSLDPAAATMLADLIGNDLGRLDNELAKLALQVESGGKVAPEAILGSVSFQREQQMWDMTNELALGRAAEALRRWRHLVQLDSSAEFRAVTWLTMWLEEVGLILNNGNTSKLTWKYKDRLPEVIRNAKTMGKQRHAQAVDLLAEMDRRAKSGLGDAVTNVEQFILSLAAPT
jgi:DNA polymerase-3 subunit delta